MNTNAKTNFFESAINSLAKVKQDISENNFDTSNLEIIDANGENLNISVHQDWELSAQKTTRQLPGQKEMDINCRSKESYTNSINNHLQSIHETLPAQLLEYFKKSEPFCHCDDFTVDTTSIGFISSCSPCRGTGKVSCKSCGGSGKITRQVHVRDDVTYQTDSNGYRREISRHAVYESRTETCSTCSGSGKITCSPCVGTGYITSITDITRNAKLHQTYASEQGQYSDKTIIELMRLPTHTLVNFTNWDIGQSTSQSNHFQIQYLTTLSVINFTTSAKEAQFSFMSFYDNELDCPHIFDKSPILDVILDVPLKKAIAIKEKNNNDAGYQFLELFQEYKILNDVMHTLSNNPDYSNKNIQQLVKSGSNEYLSEENQKLLSSALVKTFKSCVPTQSTRAIILSTIWLFFAYEILLIPILPLERKSSLLDWFIVMTIMVIIFTALGTFISKRIVDKKHEKLPKGIVTPKTTHFRTSAKFAGIFAIASFFSSSLHNYVFENYLGGGLETRLYAKIEDNKHNSSSLNTTTTNNQNESAIKPQNKKHTKNKSN